MGGRRARLTASTGSYGNVLASAATRDGACTREKRTVSGISKAMGPLLAALLLSAVLADTPPSAAEPEEGAPPAPEFTHTGAAEWINSEPLRLRDLRGHVVLLDFWTFDCWNCYRSFPWLKAVEARYRERDLVVIGVHTPELAHERVRASVVAKVAEFGLHHPVMIDNDFSYWNAMGNRYWPAFYLIDKQGHVRGRFIGETHPGDRRARRVEALIEELLGEPS